MGIQIVEELPTGGFLKFRPNQLQDIRKFYNLEKPERLKEAIQLLRDWMQKQEYFNKKDFSDGYLERLLITKKGSVERAKFSFDKICTFRTIWPHFFTSTDIQSFRNDFKTFQSLLLPDVTEDYYRVNLFKINPNVPLEAEIITKYIQYSIIIAEFTKIYDYPNGFIIMLDYQDVNLLDLLAILSPTRLQQMLSLYMEGYGMRIQGIHIITTSKVSDALISLLKQVLSKKLSSRLHVHRNMESLHELIPKKILPAEYGGDAGKLSDMMEEFLTELSTDEHMAYMKAVMSSTVDLTKKPKDSSTDDYIGMAGSFRTLSVD